MPTKRVRRPRRSSAREPSLEVFVRGDGTLDFFTGVVYPNRAEAERAWRQPGTRRAVWAKTWRLRIPAAAGVYDGLSNGGWHFLWGAVHWNVFTPEDLLKALDLLEDDRAAVARFEEKEPKAAAAIADYLALWRADLDSFERAAHIRASSDGGVWQGGTFGEAHRLLADPDGLYGMSAADSGLQRIHSRSTEEA